MGHGRIWNGLCIITLVIIILSPLPYEWSGIGQAARGLSVEISRQPDGTLASSPKAEALHRLGLPLRLQSLLLYPLLLISFQLGGGGLGLRRWLEGRIPGKARASSVRLPGIWRELLVVMLFVLVLDIALALIYLPLDSYRGLVLARQFGLSTQTGPGWAGDWIKNLLLALVIDGLVWTGFYALLRLFPCRWPIPAGALLMLAAAAFTLLAPVLITPLFYQVRPLDDQAVRARILALAERAGMSVDEVYVIDASVKTTAANAYFTGFGGAQRIVLYDTQLSGYTPDQVEVVLAHEMGHWTYHHVLLGLLGAGAAAWIGLFGLRWLLDRNWRRLGLRGPADVAGLPYLLAVVAVLTTLSLPFQNALSRYGERQADCFALRLSQRPQAFVELFERLAVQNLAVVDAPAWEKRVFYTHPPIAERIKMAETWETE